MLMALGLAIIFGLMGVINMAHGEFMVLGAYTTFIVQNLFRAHRPEGFAPISWSRCPCRSWWRRRSGIVLERSIIRRLYGRPLETLLATWGASLIIQQARVSSSATPTCVSSPRWLVRRLGR